MLTLHQIYKIPDGKPENVFAFSGEAKPKVSPGDVVGRRRDVFLDRVYVAADSDNLRGSTA